MDEEEFKDLMSGISAKGKQDAFDYEGYGVVSNLKLSREDLKKAHGIMWTLVMEATKKERDEQYLFPFGVIKSKELYMTQKKNINTTTPPAKLHAFETQSAIMRERLTNIEPLILFLIKLNEVL